MAAQNDPPRRRGRPKGTGLDDSETLGQLQQLLAQRPGLKPTTAIKELGIGGASTIRRLRDKLSALDVSQPQSRPTMSVGQRQQTQRPVLAPQGRQTSRLDPSRSGAGTRARARLGIPTDVPRQTAIQQQRQPPAEHPQYPSTPDVVAQLRLVVEATATLTKLQQQLLRQLDQDPEVK